MSVNEVGRDSGLVGGVVGDADEVYCVCRSTDISRFMIGCDKCDEWYHGDCIDVSAEDAKV